MKRRFRIILIVVGTALALLILLRLAARPFTDRSQLARALVWLDSDQDDLRRFPSRKVGNAPPVFDFKEPDAGTRKQMSSVFGAVIDPKHPEAAPLALDRFLEPTDTIAFLVIRHDVLLYEGYFQGYERASTVTSFSMAKSFTSALVGMAIEEGHIGSIEDPVTEYVPELLERDARYGDITLRHLLTMASGIRYREFMMPWSDDASTYYAPDLRTVAVSSPITGEPGRVFHYNNFHPLLLGLVLERSTGGPVAEYLETTIWRRIGMEAPGSWSLDSEASGFEKMESGINGRAIDFAKFGRLFLRRGDWEGTQVIPASWVNASTALDTTGDPAPEYQYLWWVNAEASEGLERPHFFAAGKHGQYIYVIPEQELVFVRFGRSDWYRRWDDFFESLAEQIVAGNTTNESS